VHRKQPLDNHGPEKTGRQAMPDRRALDLGVLAFGRVTIDSHSRDEARRFEKEVLALDEVIACWSVSGEADFPLQAGSRRTYA
jgi:DNA-binding Lrp family transcriptional regulator